MRELKVCPFCGGKAELIKSSLYTDEIWYVKCTECFGRTHWIFVDHPSINGNGSLNEKTRYTRAQAKEKATAAWNQRKNKKRIFV